VIELICDISAEKECMLPLVGGEQLANAQKLGQDTREAETMLYDVMQSVGLGCL